MGKSNEKRNVVAITVTHYLTEEQYEKLKELSQAVREYLNPEWTEEMSLQQMLGTHSYPHLTDVFLQLLEMSVQISLLSRGIEVHFSK